MKSGRIDVLAFLSLVAVAGTGLAGAGLTAKDAVVVGAAPEACCTNRAPAMSLHDRIGQVCKITRESVWYGHRRIHFDFRGRSAWVVEPSVRPLAGTPWTWTMQWAEAFVPRTGVPDLLKRGFHHVTIDLFDTRMDDEGVEIAAAFQEFLVRRLGFCPKARLIGPSWGGFFSVRYAGSHPENVARLYLDAPLLTFDGYWMREGREAMLKRIGPWAALEPKDRKWTPMPKMPINCAEMIAQAGIPVFLVYGGQDQTVDPRLNCLPFVTRFEKAGGKLTVDGRPMCGHHPHGFDYESRKAIIDFLTANAPAASAEPAPLIVNEPSEHYFLACTPLKDAAEPDAFASLWAFRFPTGIDLSERGVERYVDALAGGKLTHFFINVNYQRSYFPSKTVEPVWTSLDEPDSKPAWFYRDMRDAFARGLDVYAVMIRRCRERKVSPWISFRMNDIHGAAKETPADVCTFWREHPEYHLQPNEKWNWSNGFDYAQKPVRDRMSAYVREALDRYDADGVELDFLRFPNYFREGEGRKNAPIMTAFVREIRATCEAVAKRRGHPVKIAVRMTHELENALASGMDPGTWSREGLVDMLIVCNMFGSVEYDYHLDAWRKLVGDKVTLVAGTDNGIRVNERRRVLNLAEYRQWMETMRQKGADGSYFFNFTLRPFRDETWRGLLGEAPPVAGIF